MENVNLNKKSERTSMNIVSDHVGFFCFFFNILNVFRNQRKLFSSSRFTLPASQKKLYI